MPVGASLYEEGETPVHRLDPRVKLFWMLSINAIVFFFSHPFYEAAIVLYVFSIASIARLRANSFVLITGFVSFASLTGVIFWPRHVHVGDVLFTFLGNEYTTGGISFGLAMGLRVAGMVSAAVIWLRTTDPQMLSLSLRKIGLPEKFGIGLSLMIRFIPYISWEARTIIEAQTSRGLELEKGNVIVRLRKYVPIFSPLFSRMFLLIQTLSIAMESRGFGYADERSSLHELAWSRRDQLATIGVVMVVILTATVRLLGYGSIGVRI